MAANSSREKVKTAHVTPKRCVRRRLITRFWKSEFNALLTAQTGNLSGLALPDGVDAVRFRWRVWYFLDWTDRSILFCHRLVTAVLKDLRSTFYAGKRIHKLIGGTDENNAFPANVRCSYLDTYAAYVVAGVSFSQHQEDALRKVGDVSRIG